MKNLYSINSIIAIGLLLTTWGCEPEFVPDPIDPRLPMYTERGENTAGAMVNGKPWISSQKNSDWFFGDVPQKPEFHLYPDSDSLVIRFFGEFIEPIYLEFLITGFGLHDFNDLKKLEGQKIGFNATRCQALVAHDSTLYCPMPANPNLILNNGQIYFRKINLIWNQNLNVFAGTFGFNFTTPSGNEYNVTYGRFDFSISKSGQFQVITDSVDYK